MTYCLNSDWRIKRNRSFENNPKKNFSPMKLSVVNFCTNNTHIQNMDVKTGFDNIIDPDLYMNPLHMITNPLPEELAEDCSFDEVAGRFHNSNSDSDDSFQIVFSDSAVPANRPRIVSECDSEDSFIVFEDNPDSCYTSTDVFGGDLSDDDSTDCEPNNDSCTQMCGMAHTFSRTVSDLTDDSLYEENAVLPGSIACLDSEDEVDCSVKICEEIPSTALEEQPVSTGLLLDEAKKMIKRKQPPKKVHFSEAPPQVRVMRVWAFASRQARAGHWEKHAVDRDRFKRRIADVDMAISWVLKPQHRARVKFQRFMPWWHAQRRQEIAEKKVREELERKQKEEQEQKEKEELERKQKEELERQEAEKNAKTDLVNETDCVHKKDVNKNKGKNNSKTKKDKAKDYKYKKKVIIQRKNMKEIQRKLDSLMIANNKESNINTDNDSNENNKKENGLVNGNVDKT